MIEEVMTLMWLCYQVGAQEQQETVRAVRQAGEAVVACVYDHRAADAARHVVQEAARGHRPRTESSHLDIGGQGNTSTLLVNFVLIINAIIYLFIIINYVNSIG